VVRAKDKRHRIEKKNRRLGLVSHGTEFSRGQFSVADFAKVRSIPLAYRKEIFYAKSGGGDAAAYFDVPEARPGAPGDKHSFRDEVYQCANRETKRI
jgi:hypothetical protein